MLQHAWRWLLEPANQQVYFSIIAAFILGLIAGLLLKRRQKGSGRAFSSRGDKAFFKGIHYILSNDRDHAIEEFAKSVQVSSDTIETYMALGNLYRSKGDIGRAIRIRQSIILRPNIDEHVRLRALFDLALDYRKGGFLNRSLDTLEKVLQKQPSNVEALKEMERIYEEMSEWEKAFEVRKKITRQEKGDHDHILAHYQTEMGKVHHRNGDLSKARSCFQKATSIDGRCVDAYLHLGDLFFQKEEYKKAIGAWRKVAEIAPKFTFLAYRRLEGAYSKMENLKPVEDFLKECARSNSDAFTHMALARYRYNEQDYEGALKELDSALQLDPGFWEARKFKGEILLNQGMKEEALSSYADLIFQLNVPYLKFQCSNCGFKAPELQWQCPQCRQWDTINLMDTVSVDSGSAEPRSSEANTVVDGEITQEHK